MPALESQNGQRSAHAHVSVQPGKNLLGGIYPDLRIFALRILELPFSRFPSNFIYDSQRPHHGPERAAAV